MSWAAHNPEKYDDIVRKGIDDYLCRTLMEAGYEFESVEPVTALVEVIQQAPDLSGLYKELCHLASRDIVHAEQDYFSGLYDGG